MSLVRSQYEKIQEPRRHSRQTRSAPTSPAYQYGSIYQASIQDADPENPFSPSDVRVTHHTYDSPEQGSRRSRQVLW